MHRILFVAALAVAFTGVVAGPAVAQDDPPPPPGWYTGLTGGLGFTQTEFENYAAGGEGAITWTGTFNYKADELRDGHDWKTLGEIEFGQSRLGDGDFRKSADRLGLGSVYTFKNDGFVQPFISVDARTQLAKSFAYDGEDRIAEISRFLNPFYFDQAVGASKLLARGLTTRLGVAVHEVFVTKSGPLGDAFASQFTDDPETAKIEKTRVDTGIESVTEYEREFPEQKLNVKSQLKLFSQFDAPDKVDVTWKNTLQANLLDFLAVILSAEVLYDEDILNRTQLKEVLTVGFTHTFF